MARGETPRTARTPWPKRVSHYFGVGTKRQRKRRAQKKQLSRAFRKPQKPERPTPVQAVALIHSKQAQMLVARPDRFSQLLGRLLKDEPTGQYVVTRSGLSADEWAEMRASAAQAHAGFRAELSEAIQRLRRLLAVGDPLYIATMLQLSNLYGEWGTYYEPTHQGSEAKVELVVGLLATQPIAGSLEGPTDEELQHIYEEVDHIMGVLFVYNVSKPRSDDDIAMLQATGAMRWMTMRGNSYANHGQDLARAVYGPHSDWMLATYGFTIDDVIDLGLKAESLLNARVNELLEQARTFGDEVVRHLQTDAIRLPADIRTQLSTAEGRLLLGGRAFFDVLQAGVRWALTFSVDDLCPPNDGIRRARFEAALQELSIGAGSLDPSAYTGLYDESPFIERPLLEFGGRYLLVIPGMVLRDPIALLEDRLLQGKPNFSRARAKTLDRLAVTYLGTMLPGSTAYTNLFYEGTELDGLVLLEDTAFVVEGKATALSVQARRGDVERLKRDVGKAVEDAWIQGARAREFILREGDTIFRDEHGGEISIPAGSVREVIIVNPTLHDLGGHATQLRRLRALGLFPGGEFPWSVYINDLRVIAETCENPAILLHYLQWRNRLPLGDRVTVSDEIDLWGSYFFCERFGMLAEETGNVLVGNASTDFDNYYNGLAGHGPKVKAPRKFLPEPVRAFVDRMAARRPVGWREAAGVCLDLSLPELAYVSGRAKGVARQAAIAGRRVWEDTGRMALIGIPPNADIASVLAEPDPGNPTLVVYCREAAGGRPEIAWATSAKAVTFELSDFEKAAYKAAAGGGAKKGGE
ncbi:MAG: hypothetical protein QOK05_532 [Chloroflexota bacterium]|jgi:hypothetical protein|nr:hypothetical protein [Chloroflexota bacterium]